MRRIMIPVFCLTVFCLTSAWSAVGLAQGVVYEGTWHTTNRQLQGEMNCLVTDLGDG
jgi:hypothetical protein